MPRWRCGGRWARRSRPELSELSEPYFAAATGSAARATTSMGARAAM